MGVHDLHKMTDIVLSSFLSLFALFGKEEQVDETRARNMLVSYLRHHFGIRNTDSYLDFYSDMRMAYEMTEQLDVEATARSICSTLHGSIRTNEEALLLLRVMEFCGQSKDKASVHTLFKTIAQCFDIPDGQLQDFTDFVANRPTEHVLLQQPEGFGGQLKTLLDPVTGLLIFTYLGQDTVLLNDVPVLAGAYQVWLQSSVLKGKNGQPIYYSTIIDAHSRKSGTVATQKQAVEFCGRNINFRFPNSDNGMHDLSFTLRSGELLAIMGGSGTGKSTLLSILNGTLKPQQGTITINGHDIAEPRAKDLIGFVPQDDLLIRTCGSRPSCASKAWPTRR